MPERPVLGLLGALDDDWIFAGVGGGIEELESVIKCAVLEETM